MGQKYASNYEPCSYSPTPRTCEFSCSYSFSWDLQSCDILHDTLLALFHILKQKFPSIFREKLSHPQICVNNFSSVAEYDEHVTR